MLFPIGSERERQQATPLLVYLLIVANIAVFLMELMGGEQFIAAYSVVPWEITHGTDIVQPVHLSHLGWVPQAQGPSPIYLTLLTAMFMHGGWLHLGGNMLYLWIFGPHIEDNFGHLKFLVFYLLCGACASLAQVLGDPNSMIPSLGASGAIAGVLGAYLVMFPSNLIRTLLPLGIIWIPIKLPALIVIGFWIAIQLFDEFAPIMTHTAQRGGGIAYLAHIGGFIFGMLLSRWFRRTARMEHPYQ